MVLASQEWQLKHKKVRKAGQFSVGQVSYTQTGQVGEGELNVIEGVKEAG